MSLVKKLSKRQKEKEVFELQKGFIKNTMFAGMLGAAVANPVNAQERKPANVPKVDQQTQKPSYSKDQILDAIKMVESSGGKNTNHAIVTSGLNAGTRSSSAYGIMPLSSKELISKNPELKKQYGHLLKLKGKDFHEAYHKDPELDRKLASHYYNKAAKLFGNDPHKILHSWLNGRQGTLNAIKRGEDIKNHWHVKKGMKILQNSAKKGIKP